MVPGRGTWVRLGILALLIFVFGQIVYWKFVIGPVGAVSADEALPAVPVTVVDGLDHPWALAFLPNGEMLVTERPGRLRLIRDGRLLEEPVAGLPEIAAGGQGGLLDVVLHPEFTENRLVYLSYSAPGPGGKGTAVGRGRLHGMVLEDFEVIWQMERFTGTSHHFGSRLVFDGDDLFITTGDRGDRDRAQDTGDTAGKVLRVSDEGGVLEDNPVLPGQRSGSFVFSYGHRNIQGATSISETDDGGLWIHEHGPQGGDELNIIEAGGNYGWPVITYGREYGTGLKIGEGTERDDIIAPIHYWVPSIAPSGMAYYTGDKVPQWRGDLFIGSLKFGLLVRLDLDGRKVLQEERMLQGLGRIRDVRNGPDGYLYLLTDSDNGALIRLEPRPLQ